MEPVLDKKKEEKYDRQLRLWGADGQAALENAHICLINASATGTEIVKNLVLPGIGKFTVLDGNKVQASDLGNNFFLEFKSLGQSRAVHATELLKELNEWVSGTAVDRNPEEVIEKDIEFFKQFSVVVATNLAEPALLRLAKFLYDNHIPLFVCRSYGFIGYIRLAVPEHTIVESKPDNPPDDLRLYEPFPELLQLAENLDWNKLDEDSHLHAHVPFVLILVQQLHKWRAEHGGKSPHTSEREAFKAQILSLRKDVKEVNFEEAANAAFKACVPASVPSSVREILEDDKSRNVSASSSKFWVVVRALREFVNKHSLLPLGGAIPDMTADTNSYIALQHAYQSKAKADADEVYANVESILKHVGGSQAISTEYVRHVCRNAHFLQVLRYRSLEEEYTPATARSQFLSETLQDPDDNAVFYLALRAVDRFYVKHGRYPGWLNEQVQSDIPLLRQQADQLLSELGLDPGLLADKYIQEMCRFGGSEMHNIAAFLGGVASQEVIKVVTHQWVPINNTFIYNGMNSTTTTLDL